MCQNTSVHIVVPLLHEKLTWVSTCEICIPTWQWQLNAVTVKLVFMSDMLLFSTRRLIEMKKDSNVISATTHNNMHKHAENCGLVRAKTAAPRKRSKGKNETHENPNRVKEEADLESFQDVSTVKN
ncbi:uncharacterized protein LOC134522531 isoform X3 [Chroicocephalus ridibundus]|uniref:uncharacterized protein LOC134522531 isoform X3 n=1 Tax=Chroicocephalus ridibundus TaxID=1192867 RepID=UPI002FDCB318